MHLCANQKKVSLLPGTHTFTSRVWAGVQLPLGYPGRMPTSMGQPAPPYLAVLTHLDVPQVLILILGNVGKERQLSGRGEVLVRSGLWGQFVFKTSHCYKIAVYWHCYIFLIMVKLINLSRFHFCQLQHWDRNSTNTVRLLLGLCA